MNITRGATKRSFATYCWPMQKRIKQRAKLPVSYEKLTLLFLDYFKNITLCHRQVITEIFILHYKRPRFRTQPWIRRILNTEAQSWPTDKGDQSVARQGEWESLVFRSWKNASVEVEIWLEHELAANSPFSMTSRIALGAKLAGSVITSPYLLF